MIPVIECANVVPGAKLLPPDERGVNETFVGVVDGPSGRHRAYIKVLAGKQLLNELVATTIGRSLGLPIPKGYLLRVRPTDLPESQTLKTFGGEAIVFGSRDADHPSLLRRFTGDQMAARSWVAANFKAWDVATLFDEWVANQDRHVGNLLVAANDEIWLIDHSHCFTGPVWNPPDLVPSRTYANQLADIFVPTLSLPRRVEFKSKAGQEAMRYGGLNQVEIMSASLADKILPVAELDALKSFLANRIPELLNIVGARIGIPNLRGQP